MMSYKNKMNKISFFQICNIFLDLGYYNFTE
jgi:hypothetical protein